MSDPFGRVIPWKPWGILQQEGRCGGRAPLPADASLLFGPLLRGSVACAASPRGPAAAPAVASDVGGSGDLARCLELLKSIGSTAVDEAALLGFREAADFADNVEEVSRAAEYLQIVAAGAVQRSRREAAVAARSAAVGSGTGTAGSGGRARGRLGHRMGHRNGRSGS